ncbi:MAG: DUF1015 domain-containing protein [Actinobacteria bacterium]|nr:DUF1015 domain-containing protein [Actinomycetota bacterium]
MFNENNVKDFSMVISPPYDVISPELKEKLRNANEHNIVNIILPDGKNCKKYTNASTLLDRWINEGVLVTDDRECFYIIEISFKTGHDTSKIKGFIGLTKIEPFEDGNIIPHEKTLSAPKEDRLKLLKKCMANFGMIYTLYHDNENKISQILDSVSSNGPFMDVSPYYDSKLHFRLWRACDKKDIIGIKTHMKDRKLLIADGHHRYETSMIYRNKNIKDRKNINESFFPGDYILTLYMESSQKNIKIYPTYRMVKFSNFPGIAGITEILGDLFKPAAIGSVNHERIVSLLDCAKSAKEKAFVISGKDSAYHLKYLKTRDDIVDIRQKYDNLDINILHNVLLKTLEKKLGILNTGFTNSAEEVFYNVRKNIFDIGIFLNTPSVSEMEEICLSGYLMPQKSTYFCPKPCTGLVMYKF